jgi:hypothetical protein
MWLPRGIQSSVAGPGFWGLINPQWPLCTKGRRQSPINVEPDKLLYDPHLRPLHLDKHKVRILGPPVACTTAQISMKYRFLARINFFFLPNEATAPSGASVFSLLRLHDHIQTHHILQKSSGRVISPTQRFLSDNTQHSSERGIHAPRRDSNPHSQQANGRRTNTLDSAATVIGTDT